MQAIVSVHDVMPETLPAVAGVVERLAAFPREQICLLVVPGRDWTPEQLELLRGWQAAGFELAAHGWLHHTGRITTAYHRLHSRFFSRDVAEHLSRPAEEICALMERSYAWWGDHRFDPPALYVPPAWAMGRVSRWQLGRLPFRFYETTTGYFDGRSHRFRRLPLAGFEADTAGRARILRLSNRLNRALSRPGRPLRLSLHPYDFDFRLGATIMSWLEGIEHWVDYRQLF